MPVGAALPIRKPRAGDLEHMQFWLRKGPGRPISGPFPLEKIAELVQSELYTLSSEILPATDEFDKSTADDSSWTLLENVELPAAPSTSVKRHRPEPDAVQYTRVSIETKVSIVTRPRRLLFVARWFDFLRVTNFTFFWASILYFALLVIIEFANGRFVNFDRNTLRGIRQFAPFAVYGSILGGVGWFNCAMIGEGIRLLLTISAELQTLRDELRGERSAKNQHRAKGEHTAK